jgi:murein DD-endopeptidase MepM/ murein hydrolase activator NlpD
MECAGNNSMFDEGENLDCPKRDLFLPNRFAAEARGTDRCPLWVRGARQYARISVEAYDYRVEEIELPDIPQAHPSPADLRRVAQEELIESRVWLRREGPARFTLPLGPPAKPFPEGKAFGVKRIYNGKPAPQPHTGIDYPVPIGSAVLAVSEGTVVIARDFFYAGKAVFIDHGNGLVSMYFHLASIDVREGQTVRKGHTLGRVGSTGRATGPHLFFAVRWHGARINPDLLFSERE